jgi:hypothetical protein
MSNVSSVTKVKSIELASEEFPFIVSTVVDIELLELPVEIGKSFQ